MATVAPPSQSPQVSTRTTPPLPAHATAPFTPIHSPHHSVASSVSYRTPVHTLSIHEYRKQQHTPSSGVATPSGRTLRRKAAAPALNTLERVPSTRSVNKPSSRPLLRPLQPSQSAQQLQSYYSSLQFQTPPDQPFRAQSAEPRTHFGSTSTISTSSVKERHFNSRKRLPRPTITTGPPAPFLQTAIAKPHIPRQSPRPLALDIGREASYSSDARTTPTASTFSLSRFPPPPNLRESTDSIPSKDLDDVRKTAHPFAPQRPVTPPATPATIHYRGASFDLVNPHDSLVLHDIVTPSRDFGSSEFLVAPIAVEPLVVSSEMAPKRALYGDLNSAHASITGRAEDSIISSDLDLPLPPTPAAVSPDSSSYTSPVYSPQSRFAPAPLAVNNVSTDSRFSIKSLTRSLTRRLTKAQDSHDGQELQDLHDPYAPNQTTGPVANPSRSFKNVYISSPKPAYYPLNPTSPTTPQSEGFQQDPHLVRDDDDMDYQESGRPERVLSEPLASMLPDEHSTQIGRAETSRLSYSSPDFIGGSYYGETESIYPSSSIYSGQDRRRSAYQQSILSDPRQSRFYSHYGSTNATDLARVYSPEDFSDSFEYDERERDADASNVHQESVSNSEEKVDTISKIIDQYNPHATISQPASEVHTQPIGTDAYVLAPPVDNAAPATTNAMENNPSEPVRSRWQETPTRNQQFRATDITRPTFAAETVAWRKLAGPPAHAAPLAPPFEYDRPPFGIMVAEQSDVFSRQSYSSYGDTRHLLQIPQTNPDFSGANTTLQPSSSYSQPTPIRTDLSSPYAPTIGDRSPRTPQEALDEAEKIFEDMSIQKHKSTPEPIPAIWAKRHSGGLLPSANFVDRSDDLPESPHSGNHPSDNVSDGDWESIAGGSRGARDSLGSIADYSSTDSTRNSLGLSLASSPPIAARMPGAVSSPISPSRRGPLYADTEAAAISRSHPGDFPYMGGAKQHYTPSPWSNPYAFSDKETQELLASGPNDKIMVEHESSRNQVSLRDTTGEMHSGGPTEKSYMDNQKGDTRGVTGKLGMHGTRRTINPITSPEQASFSKSGLPQSPTSPFSVTMSPTGLSEKDFESQGGSSRRASFRPALRLSTAFHRSGRRASRTSVAGQTKLREMMLSPARKTLSSQDTNFSQYMASSQRPSTADTNTPLHAPPTLDLPASPRTVIAHQYSPHLLCPERAVNPEDEERRRKLSWMILACFCLLPPCIILYRLWGDSLIASLTQGKLGHCTRRSKNVALVAGIAVNIGVAAIIVVVIVATHALGAV